MRQVGIVIFDELTILDAIGPYEILARLPDTSVHFLSRSLDPVCGEHGLRLSPDETLDRAPPLDVLCVPGGPGVNRVLADDQFLRALARVAHASRLVTSVCTGALLLGAAGLLQGYQATTHWRYLDLLPLFGATPITQRVVHDRDRITAAGVSAGIDFALSLAADIAGAPVARQIQLMIEYDPQPAFDSGSPERAHASDLRALTGQTEQTHELRRKLIEKRLAALTPTPPS